VPGRAVPPVVRPPSTIKQKALRKARPLSEAGSAKTRPAALEGNEPFFSLIAFRHGPHPGPKLMLIDLDRCTRCDECVQACVKTHSTVDLGSSSTANARSLPFDHVRACRYSGVHESVCPVGSIRRRHIHSTLSSRTGASAASSVPRTGPYGSIQMHDQGILPEQSHGWRFLPARAPRVTGPSQLIATRLARRCHSVLVDRDLEVLYHSRRRPPIRRTTTQPGRALRRAFDLDRTFSRGPTRASRSSSRLAPQR